MIEKLVYKSLSIDPEGPEVKAWTVALFELFAKLDEALNGTTYEGVKLPTKGAFLGASNHTDFWNSVKGYRLGQRSGRIFRAFARESLIDPTIKESASVLARTGKRQDFLHSGFMPLRRFIAELHKGVDAIPVARGGGLKELNDFLKRGKEKFDRGLPVGMFIQETRHKDGRLENPMGGAAFLAKHNPDIPVYPIGITVKKPQKVRVGSPFTYNQMVGQGNFTVLIYDRIADLLDEDIRDDWYQNLRPAI